MTIYEEREVTRKERVPVKWYVIFEDSNNADYDTVVFNNMEYSKLKILLGK